MIAPSSTTCSGRSRRTRPSGSTGGPSSASGTPDGEVSRRGAEEVATVERPRDRVERVLRIRQLVRRLDPASARGRQQQPVVRTDVQPALRIPERQRPTWAADSRIDDREMHADGHEPDRVRENECALEDRRRRDPVRDVDDLRLRGDALDDPVTGSDEVVLEPEVAQERDEHVAERNAGSGVRG